MPTILTSGLMVNTVVVDMAKSAITNMTASRTMAMSAFIYSSSVISWLLFFNPGIHPVDECLVPEYAVLRLQNPVAFIGEEQQFRWHFLQLQGGEQLQCLVERHAVVQFAVDHQGRRVELLHEIVGRPFGVILRLVPRRAAVLPHGEPQLLRGAELAVQVLDAIMRDQSLEALRMAQ